MPHPVLQGRNDKSALKVAGYLLTQIPGITKLLVLKPHKIIKLLPQMGLKGSADSCQLPSDNISSVLYNISADFLKLA